MFVGLCYVQWHKELFLITTKRFASYKVIYVEQIIFGRSCGIGVMGGDSCSDGSGFESLSWIIDSFCLYRNRLAVKWRHLVVSLLLLRSFLVFHK